jgi:cytidylate kinase
VKIAIDGPAASGKGTLARRLAAHFGLTHLDSGSLYRAVAAKAMAEGIDLEDHSAVAAVAGDLEPADLDEPALRSREVGAAASVVAAIPQVRQALLSLQRGIARKGAVIDGRDIGTVVLPDADVKLFVVAELPERARRRAAELRAAGEPVEEAEVLADLAERDARDAERTVAPMSRATDAHLLDTTDLAIEAAFQAALRLIEAQLRAEGKAGPPRRDGAATAPSDWSIRKTKQAD